MKKRNSRLRNLTQVKFMKKVPANEMEIKSSEQNDDDPHPDRAAANSDDFKAKSGIDYYSEDDSEEGTDNSAGHKTTDDETKPKTSTPNPSFYGNTTGTQAPFPGNSAPKEIGVKKHSPATSSSRSTPQAVTESGGTVSHGHVVAPEPSVTSTESTRKLTSKQHTWSSNNTGRYGQFTPKNFETVGTSSGHLKEHDYQLSDKEDDDQGILTTPSVARNWDLVDIRNSSQPAAQLEGEGSSSIKKVELELGDLLKTALQQEGPYRALNPINSKQDGEIPFTDQLGLRAADFEERKNVDPAKCDGNLCREIRDVCPKFGGICVVQPNCKPGKAGGEKGAKKCDCNIYIMCKSRESNLHVKLLNRRQ